MYASVLSQPCIPPERAFRTCFSARIWPVLWNVLGGAFHGKLVAPKLGISLEHTASEFHNLKYGENRSNGHPTADLGRIQPIPECGQIFRLPPPRGVLILRLTCVHQLTVGPLGYPLAAAGSNLTPASRGWPTKRPFPPRRLPKRVRTYARAGVKGPQGAPWEVACHYYSKTPKVSN
jgi:hypothetical protein